jgi:hypothetical protein
MRGEGKRRDLGLCRHLEAASCWQEPRSLDNLGSRVARPKIARDDSAKRLTPDARGLPYCRSALSGL